MDPSKFFNRKINIRDPKTPYEKGKFIDGSQNYSNRISSRINQSPLTKSLFSFRNKVFRLENLLTGILNLDKKKNVQRQRIKANEVPDKKPKSKGPQIFGNIIQRPKTGALGLIRDFVTFTFLGWLFTRIQPLLGGLTKLAPLLEGMAWFIGGTIKNMVDIFATFLKLGFDTKEKFDDIVGDIKKNTEGIDKVFDATLNPLKAVFTGVIQLANSFLDVSVGQDELNEAKTQVAKEETVDTVTPMPPLPKVDAPQTPQTSDPFPRTPTRPGMVQAAHTGGVIRGYNKGGRIDPRTPITRGIEPRRREIPKPKPIIQPQKTAPRKDVGGDKKVKQLYDQTTGGIPDFIPLPSFFRSDKKSGFTALMGASEEYKKPMTNDILGIGNMMGASVDSALGQKIEKKSYTQFADGIKYLVDYGRTQPEEFAKIDLEDMVRKIVEPRVNMAINRIQEEINKKSTVGDGMEDEYYGDGSEVSGSEDFPLLVAIAALESGSAQGQADVAQSVYNRLADKTYGKTLREVLLADAQYQPAYIDPNSSSGPGTKTDPMFKIITDENSAIDAMASYYSKKSVRISRSEIQKQYRSAAAALANPSLQENARKHVGGRTEFLGRPTAGAVWRGSAADNRFFAAYGSGTQMSRGAVPIPTGLFDSGESGPQGKIGKFNFLGGGQDPGQVGIDFTISGHQNIAVLPGKVVDIQHQYNPNAIGGDGRRGAGYGWYVVIRSKSPVDNSEVDIIYAHFPKNAIKVRKGQSVGAGQILGRMATAQEFANPNTRKEVGSGTGPHSSLDFYSVNSRSFHPNGRKIGDFILNQLRRGQISSPSASSTQSGRPQAPRSASRSPEVERIAQTPSGEPYLIQGKMYYVDLKNNKIFTVNERGERVEIKVGPGQNEWLLKEIYKMRQMRQNQRISSNNQSESLLADQAIRRKYGGLVYKNGNSPTLPSQKYSSYGSDQSPQIAIQPVIISNQVPVPVSSGAVPFAVPVISSSDTRLT